MSEENKNKNTNTQLDNNQGEPGTNKDDVKDVYTREEVEKLLQQEADRRVTQARKKFESELEKRIAAERKEAERLAKLSEEEKVKHKLEEQRRQLEQRERELLHKELKLEAVKILSEKNLPVDMIDMLVGQDADQTMNNIEAFEAAFRSAVEEAVNKRLGTTSGTPGSGTSERMITRDDLLNKLSYQEKIKLMNEQPELYNKLAKDM